MKYTVYRKCWHGIKKFCLCDEAGFKDGQIFFYSETDTEQKLVAILKIEYFAFLTETINAKRA